VGLAVPHLARSLVGADHRWVMPYGIVLGAVVLLVADVLGRMLVRPAELEAGIVVALVGAPFFIYIVRRQRVREL
jgi:iron complex transport system permease protein